MQKQEAWYLGERAEQLAIVYLSRRDDLVITRKNASDYGLDLLVSLTNDGLNTGRVFGVQVKALRSDRQIRQGSPRTDHAKIDLRRVEVPQDIPFPLCLFVFNVETDNGYYRWIKKPASGLDKRAHLLLNDENVFEDLSTEAIADIVRQVNNWYDSKLKIPA